MTSARYGLASQVTFGTGDALTALGFTANQGATGQDVAGYFTVNGNVSRPWAAGNFSRGRRPTPTRPGWKSARLFSAAQILSGGAVASLNVTQGLASSLNTALNNLLDPVNGEMTSLNQGFTQSINSINTEIAQENAYIAEKQQSLQTQFAALEATVSKLQTIGNFLTAQFSSASSVKSGIPQPTLSTNTSPSTGSSSSANSSSSSSS